VARVAPRAESTNTMVKNLVRQFDVDPAEVEQEVQAMLQNTSMDTLAAQYDDSVKTFSVDTITTALMFMVWGLLVSFSDIALKPLLMGRGVDAPMLVILLGAIGGLLLHGLIGLFVGAVVLALGYALFTAWLEEPDEPEEPGDREPGRT